MVGRIVGASLREGLFRTVVCFCCFSCKETHTMLFSRKKSAQRKCRYNDNRGHVSRRRIDRRGQNTEFHSLESRTLMSFSAHINFAPSSAADYHHGYVEDSGGTYGGRNGLTYGWNTAEWSQGRNRD